MQSGGAAVADLLGGKYLLRELLTHRFGSLPYWVSQKVLNAPEEEVLHWGERLLDNTLSLKEVFSSSGQAGKTEA
jgi:hypothetical protein